MSSTTTDETSDKGYVFVPGLPPAKSKGVGRGRGLDKQQVALAESVREQMGNEQSQGWVLFLERPTYHACAMKAQRIRKGVDKSWASVGTFEVTVRPWNKGYGAWARFVSSPRSDI